MWEWDLQSGVIEGVIVNWRVQQASPDSLDSSVSPHLPKWGCSFPRAREDPSGNEGLSACFMSCHIDLYSLLLWQWGRGALRVESDRPTPPTVSDSKGPYLGAAHSNPIRAVVLRCGLVWGITSRPLEWPRWLSDFWGHFPASENL